MIRVLLEPVPADATIHVMASNGIRMACTMLGAPLTDSEAKEALSTVRDARESLELVETEDRSILDRVIAAQRLLARYGLTLAVQNEYGDPVEHTPTGTVEDVPELEDENQEPANPPSYVASLISLSVLGVCNGDVSQAVRLTNTIRYAYKTQDPDGLEVWDDVLRILFDAFPPREQPTNSIEDLATEVNR